MSKVPLLLPGSPALSGVVALERGSPSGHWTEPHSMASGLESGVNSEGGSQSHIVLLTPNSSALSVWKHLCVGISFQRLTMLMAGSRDVPV